MRVHLVYHRIRRQIRQMRVRAPGMSWCQISNYLVDITNIYKQIIHTHMFSHTHKHHMIKRDESATGSSTSKRVRTTFSLWRALHEFDMSACQLWVKSRNILVPTCNPGSAPDSSQYMYVCMTCVCMCVRDVICQSLCIQRG